MQEHYTAKAVRSVAVAVISKWKNATVVEI